MKNLLLSFILFTFIFTGNVFGQYLCLSDKAEYVQRDIDYNIKRLSDLQLQNNSNDNDFQSEIKEIEQAIDKYKSLLPGAIKEDHMCDLLGAGTGAATIQDYDKVILNLREYLSLADGHEVFYDWAIEDFVKALSFKLSIALKKEEWDKIISYGDEILKYNPKNMYAAWNVGYAYSSKNDVKNAIVYYKIAYELATTDKDIEELKWNLNRLAQLEKNVNTSHVAYTAYTAAVKLAANAFIVDQSANPVAYRLADNLLRQEAIGTVGKVLGIIADENPINYVCKGKFFDLRSSNDWVCRAAELAAGAGLTNATNTNFRPKDNLTRFEALVFSLRAVGLVPDGPQTQSSIINLGFNNGLIPSAAGFNINATATRGEFFRYIAIAIDIKKSSE